MRSILILGGYGTFGGRLAMLLAGDARLDLLIAGRSRAKAESFCATLPQGALTRPVAFDRDGDLEAQLSALRPDLVVDATGPFQTYGGDPYRVARAAIAQGVNYIDLADASDFVAGIAGLDADARRANVYVLSGVSSFPALTVAVVRSLSGGLARVRAISAGIAPSPYAGVGLNVIRAIASYAGQPIRIRRDGGEAIAYGLIDARRRTIAPPGLTPLNNIRFSLVDTPDLRVLPRLWPEARSAWVGAGPVPAILHRALSALAWLVRWRVVATLTPLAPLFHAVVNRLRWGEHRGGMFVDVDGVDSDGAAIRRSWHMLAEGEDGPLIPSMAAAAIVRAELAGRRPSIGARASVDDVELSDYDTLFAARAIRYGVREERAATAFQPLYRRALATAWDLLPPRVRAMHESDVSIAHGVAEVTRGTNPLSRFAAFLFGFPPAGREIPVTVRFARHDGTEIWTRSFDGHAFSSRQRLGVGRDESLLCESFGPFSFGLALFLDQGKLRLIVRRWTFFGMPMPLALAPTGEAFEEERDGFFRFYVDLRLPLAGLIVAYRGWLEPEANG